MLGRAGGFVSDAMPPSELTIAKHRRSAAAKLNNRRWYRSSIEAIFDTRLVSLMILVVIETLTQGVGCAYRLFVGGASFVWLELTTKGSECTLPLGRAAIRGLNGSLASAGTSTVVLFRSRWWVSFDDEGGGMYSALLFSGYCELVSIKWSECTPTTSYTPTPLQPQG